MSHPSWVCGLKPLLRNLTINNGTSHPSWVCGLKHGVNGDLTQADAVTPFVGVWIETIDTRYVPFDIDVTPFVGVWIETH